MPESFNVDVVVRQGDALSVIVFNLVLDYIIKKLDIRENISTKVEQINAYADDVVIISRNLKALEEALWELDNTAQEIGLTVSQEKTKYMRVSKKTHHQCKHVAVGRFKIISSFPVWVQ
jgi:hypothetical protein